MEYTIVLVSSGLMSQRSPGHPSPRRFPSVGADCAQGTAMTPILDLSPMASVKSECSQAVAINSWLICLLLSSLSLYQDIVAETMKRRERREWEARR